MSENSDLPTPCRCRDTGQANARGATYKRRRRVRAATRKRLEQNKRERGGSGCTLTTSSDGSAAGAAAWVSTSSWPQRFAVLLGLQICGRVRSRQPLDNRVLGARKTTMTPVGTPNLLCAPPRVSATSWLPPQGCPTACGPSDPATCTGVCTPFPLNFLKSNLRARGPTRATAFPQGRCTRSWPAATDPVRPFTNARARQTTSNPATGAVRSPLGS